MSEENVELARRGYAALNEAYKTGDYTAWADMACDPEIVVKTAGDFPETGEWRGREGAKQFVAGQAEAFEQMWVEPEEFIEAGERLVVPVRFGGRARHTGIEVEFAVVHVGAYRDGKVVCIEMYGSRAAALEAVGLSE